VPMVTLTSRSRIVTSCSTEAGGNPERHEAMTTSPFETTLSLITWMAFGFFRRLTSLRSPLEHLAPHPSSELCPMMIRQELALFRYLPSSLIASSQQLMFLRRFSGFTQSKLTPYPPEKSVMRATFSPPSYFGAG